MSSTRNWQIMAAIHLPLLLVYINKVLLAHSRTHWFNIIEGCFCAMKADWTVTLSVWPTKPKIFTIWAFVDKNCEPLSEIGFHFPGGPPHGSRGSRQIQSGAPPTHKEWESTGQVQVLTCAPQGASGLRYMHRDTCTGTTWQQPSADEHWPGVRPTGPSYHAVSVGVGAPLNFLWELFPFTFFGGYIKGKLEREKVKHVSLGCSFGSLLLVYFHEWAVFAE